MSLFIKQSLSLCWNKQPCTSNQEHHPFNSLRRSCVCIALKLKMSFHAASLRTTKNPAHVEGELSAEKNEIENITWYRMWVRLSRNIQRSGADSHVSILSWNSLIWNDYIQLYCSAFLVYHEVMCKLNLSQTLSEALSDDFCCDFHWTSKEVAVQCVPVEAAPLLSCTLLGIKAVHWSILMHLFSENLLCSEPSIRWLIVYLQCPYKNAQGHC